MSTSRGSGAAGNGGGVQSIPSGSRKIVQSLKEIVNCTEAEIYATLKDCNMDPNEAVNRLLSQDPFHEVKSKREKKKEGKDTPEPRSRGANNNSSRTGKTGADRYLGRGSSTPYYSSESASLPGNSTYKKENGSAPYTSSLSSVPAISGNSRSSVSAGFSNGATAENKGYLFGAASAAPSGVQPASGYQSAWVGAPGQVSMADIVKMGRPHNKASNVPNASHYTVQGPSTNTSHNNLRFPEDHESGTSSAQQIPINEEWPIMPPATKVVSMPYYAVDSEQHLEASDIPSDGVNGLPQAEEVQEEDDDSIENSVANAVESDSISSRKLPEDDSRGASLYENDLYKDMDSYQHQGPHDFHEVEEIDASVSSVTRNMQQLSVENDDRGVSSDGYTPSVVIPDHLQVQNTDCSHLSFGSFGSGMGAVYSSGTVKSLPAESNLEEPHSEADIPSVGHMDTRNSDYYVDDSLRNAPDGGLFHRSSASPGDYDPSSASQQEELKQNAEGARGSQYSFPPSNPGYTFDGAQHINATFNQTSSQMQNLAPFSDVMQSYTNALPSTLSPANVQPNRESDLQYSPFPVTQSMSAKFGNSVSSIGGSAISMSEALKTAGFSLMQPAPQTLSGTNVATGPPLPQHLVHPYPQPTLPLGPFTNMIGYPFLPQSYTYLPSAFQQTFAGNSSYHQSLAAVLPQYKNNVSASSLPPSAAIASGYGAFGNTTTIPGNFPVNPPTAPSGTTLSYDDVLSSQYKDNSHLVSLQQQNENSAMWPHGANNRTMSAVPASTYYNYQGQNQQSGGFRQAQQPSQNYGALGYPNFYHSQSGSVSLDQQQNQRDGSLGGSQGQQQQQPKQSQIWQNSY
ncbi:hypothetical protein C2S51_005258 [Perilla frutescens var. frutescens]|nr:hypothetical protein C2S51_005258 [Perilla frutescens var. frutescens]